ncbi:TPA: glycerophosphoryl diester phosphodiesterase [Aeromonas veronii]|uniref:glycerophosphoryl diester phosphodiesterase n=1 Tax=Aeromonas TaxID=642 RepID=UPI00330FD761|nr:glycerophosphoryl diester phosphodiesterase [Aeromonas veronii]HDO1336347.1 glycerophosphoryl diester phosphodiesterase [Aeromonas veronii]HDO1340891.1 glycerophosphoryl diester phosphodiesterase [Aeromonas veronii]HDO1345401.1 glycerophosphoryl diester phosphodiesterase [Aeromonas veronii]HDO1349971.1 glycerophosphoryl diester phosphodiesterase [Aeromonas veronii]
MVKKIIAHRGMSSLAPENTLAAFRLCRRHGIKWFECDADILADGTVVISHDDTLDRCTNISGSLYTLTADYIHEIDAGGWFSDEYIGERIPTLRELIQVVNEYELDFNLEIKSCTCGWQHTKKLIDGCIKELESLHPERNVIVSSFNHLALVEFKRHRPDTDIACLFEHANLWPDWHSILQACQAYAIHLEDKCLTKEKILMFKQAGYVVNVYTVNSLSRANELFNWGADGIFTDVAHDFPNKYKEIHSL